MKTSMVFQLDGFQDVRYVANRKPPNPATAPPRTYAASLVRKTLRPKAAAAIYGRVAADAALPQPYRDLALVRQTAAEFDTLPPATVIARLTPLAKAGNPWFGSAGEMVGAAYLKQNNPKAAAPIFAAVAKDESVPETIRSRAVQMAGTLGVDAIPEPKAGVAGRSQ